MPAVAEVTFKASGQQAVEGAFRSVGSAAGDTTSKIQQNSSAMKSMGQGMKSSVSGIASAATAFATLSLSVVNTWRAYRDLTDAQIAVDKANLRVAKTTEAIRKSEAAVAAIKKESGKGSLESVAFTNKMRLAEQKLAAARKDGKHTGAELAVMQDNINLAQKAGSGTSQKLTDAENKLALQKEQLGVQTDVAKEAQERFNDTQQNFYLSILPTALSGFASLSMAFSGMKNMFSGGGGLIGMFGPLGIALAAISVAIIAFQTNFLGLRDKIGGVITWFKDRFGVWKQAIEDVFSFIQKGDWGMAFNRIKQAAASFWADLKKTVPFFGQVESIINKIKGGDWEGAFHDIHLAAFKMWEQLKKQVPFFGGAETFFKQLFSGDLSGAFKTLAAGVKTGLESVFGKDAVGGFQEKIGTMVNSAKNLLAQFAHDLNAPGGAISLIQTGLAKLGKGDVVGGFTGIAAGMQKAVDGAKHVLDTWVLSNFGINLPGLEGAATNIGNKILTGIKSGLTFVARTWIDPIVTALLDPTTWTSAGGAALGAITAIGQILFNFVAGAIQGAAKDPKGTASWWGNIGKAIWDGIVGWFKTNLPNATVAIQGIAQALKDAVNSSGIAFQNLGITIWNKLVDGFKAGIEAANKIPTLGGLLTNQVSQAIQSPEWKNLGHLALITPEANTKPFVDKTKKAVTTVTQQKPKIQLDANLAAANAKWQAFMHKVASTPVKIPFSVAGGSSNIRIGSQRGAYGGPHQHGWNTTVKRPTHFIAGEGGRPEDVYVKPKGSAGQRPDGGGFNGTINVYVDGVLRPARYDMGARK